MKLEENQPPVPRCPSLFDKWYGIFYMPILPDTAGHTKTTGGNSKCSGTRQIRTNDLWVKSQPRQPPNQNDCLKSEDQIYPGSSLMEGSSAITALWCFHTRARQRQDKTNVEPVHSYDAFHTRFVGHPQGGGPTRRI